MQSWVPNNSTPQKSFHLKTALIRDTGCSTREACIIIQLSLDRSVNQIGIHWNFGR